MIDKAPLPHNQQATDNIWEVLFTQRAIRYWQDKPVPRALLEQVISAASKAPSGENSQPWMFVVVDEAQQRAQSGRVAFKKPVENHIYSDRKIVQQ